MPTSIGLGIGIGFRRGGGVAVPPSYSAEANALFARFTTPPSDPRKLLIDNYIVALKNASVWAKLDLFYVKAAADNQAAQRNWLADAFNLTEVNAPTFTVDRGYTGNGTTMELTTGYNPSLNAVQLAQNSGTAGAYALTDGTTTAFDIGTVIATSAIGARARIGGNAGGRMNATAGLSGTAGGTQPLHITIIRRDSANTLMFRQGLQINTAPVASAALQNAPISILRSNSLFSDRQIAITYLGAALSDVEALAMHNASLAYLQGVGAA